MSFHPDRARRQMQDAVAHAAAAPDAQEAAQRLTPLFADIGWLEALAEEWLAPLRTGGPVTSSIQTSRHGPVLSLPIAATPPVRLILTLFEGAAERAETDEPAQGIGFSGALGLYRILSDQPVDAQFGAISPDPMRCRTRSIQLRPGQPLMLDERRRSLRIFPQAGPILLLRGRIEHVPAPQVRRYALPEGKFIGTVQPDAAFARSAMLLSVLREAGAHQAVPEILALLDRTTGRERWTVLRELLALDAPAALPRLCAMAAQDPDTGLRSAAQAVLQSQFPTLQEAEPCPA